MSRAGWVGKSPLQVVWERVPSELGGNLFHQSWVGKCPVRVGWEIVPCKLDGNASVQVVSSLDPKHIVRVLAC